LAVTTDTNQEAGYGAGSFVTKGSNTVLRQDIVGGNAPESLTERMINVSGIPLANWEKGALNKMFNALPTGLQDIVQDLKAAGIDAAEMAKVTDQQLDGFERGRMQDISGRIDPQKRHDLESNLRAELGNLDNVRNGQHPLPENLRLEDIPAFVRNLPTDDQAAFKRYLEDRRLEEETARRAAEDPNSPENNEPEPTESALAFMAFTIGDNRAERVRNYRRQVDGDDEELSPTEKAMQTAQDYALMEAISNINTQIANIDTRLGQIAKRVEQIDARVAEIDKRQTELQTLITAETEKREKLVGQDQALAVEQEAVTEEVTVNKAQAVAADAAAVEANERAETALAAALESQNGQRYAMNAEGQYVYVTGPDMGQVVPDEQRASPWDEWLARGKGLVGVGGGTAEEMIQSQKERDAINQAAEEARRTFDESRERLQAIKGERAEIKGQIAEIDRNLAQYGQEFSNLNDERAKLLLEKEGLSNEQRQLLEQRAGLVAQRDDLRSQMRDARQDLSDSAQTMALNSVLASHLEQQSKNMENLVEAQKSWTDMAGQNIAEGLTREQINAQDDAAGVCSLRVTREEYEQMLSESERLQQESDQLRQVLADHQAGKPVDLSKLPESVRTELAVETLKNNPYHLNNLDLKSFSPEAQQRIIETTINTRLDRGLSVDKMMQSYPEHREVFARAIVSHESDAKFLEIAQRHGITEAQWKAGDLMKPENAEIMSAINSEMDSWKQQRTAEIMGPQAATPTAAVTPSVDELRTSTPISMANADGQGIQADSLNGQFAFSTSWTGPQSLETMAKNGTLPDPDAVDPALIAANNQQQFKSTGFKIA